ncbi:MAG TPA: DUF1990 domain-containing protein [Polyangiaceae bacterium]|nr:DUF1990 domain-containing protein [Polyangiaceae bacterium]
MFHLLLPTDDAIRSTLRGLAEAPFTYAEVGATLAPLAAAPRGFVLDRYGVELGRGRRVFERACGALARIENYPASFTRIVRAHDELAPGALFAAVAAHLGFGSVHPCRVIHVVREPERFGFTFGTLPGHAECGEESFTVTMSDDRVRYDVLAFSRPSGLLARLGAPVARAYQRRFQRETLATMRAKVGA